VVGNGSCAGGSGGGAGRVQEFMEWQEELLEELMSNTKVIVDAMDLFT